MGNAVLFVIFSFNAFFLSILADDVEIADSDFSSNLTSLHTSEKNVMTSECDRPESLTRYDVNICLKLPKIHQLSPIKIRWNLEVCKIVSN